MAAAEAGAWLNVSVSPAPLPLPGTAVAYDPAYAAAANGAPGPANGGPEKPAHAALHVEGLPAANGAGGGAGQQDSDVVERPPPHKPGWASSLGFVRSPAQEATDAARIAAADALFKEDHMTANTPQDLSYLQLFVIFLSFGIRAFGGPVAQIAQLKTELVQEGKWISVERFNKVFAIYQVIPGPEAAELCIFFGVIAKGRLGGLVAGLGFISPGWILMLIMSWIYADYGITDGNFLASFRAMQPAVSAMAFRAAHKLAEHAFTDPKTKQLNNALFFLFVIGAIANLMKVNYFITIGLCAVLYLLWHQRLRAAAGLLLLAALGAYIAYASQYGIPSSASLSSGQGSDRSYQGLFVEGLIAGSISFGGAYTAVPFVQQDVVYSGQWMTNLQFLDGLAIGSIIPSPLVIFVCFVGFIGARWGGAILMTVGMFIPAFLFPLIGHDLLARAVTWQWAAPLFDGVTASVVGIILITALSFLKSAVRDPLSAIIFVTSLTGLYFSSHKLTPLGIIGAAAAAGQVLYVAYA